MSQDQISSASLSADGSFNAIFSLSLSDLIERFYTPEGSSSNKKNSRYTSKNNTSSRIIISHLKLKIYILKVF